MLYHCKVINLIINYEDSRIKQDTGDKTPAYDTFLGNILIFEKVRFYIVAEKRNNIEFSPYKYVGPSNIACVKYFLNIVDKSIVSWENRSIKLNVDRFLIQKMKIE